MIFIYDGVYIPYDDVNLDLISDRFSRRIFDDKSCERCEFVEDRFSYMCNQCQAYKGNFILWREEKVKGKDYAVLPRGAMKELGGVYTGNHKIVDKRISHSIDKDLKITSDLFPHQKKAIRTAIGHDKCGWSDDYGTYVGSNIECNGIISAPPRTGKTLMVLALAISLGCRTLILAHQGDLLKQFVEDIEKHTNFDDVGKFKGEHVYGICRKLSDFSRYQIALSTYQQFITDAGQKKLKAIRKLFGSIFVDESHRSAASSYSKVVSMLPARNRVGVTGTVERKDGLEFITSDIVGPVLASVYAETLTPTVYLHKTKAAPVHTYRTWVPAVKWLSKDEKRNRLIAKYVVRDLNSDRSILIPVTFVEHTTTLCDMINDAYGSEIAVAFHGKANRKQIIDDARTGIKRVVIGIRSIISTGINVPRWDCLYVIAPISNTPTFTQEVRRICTPMAGKNKPIIRMFIDDMGLSVGCAKTCYYKTFFPLRFDLPQKTRDRAKQVFNSKGRRQTHDEYQMFGSDSKADLNTNIKGRSLFDMCR